MDTATLLLTAIVFTLAGFVKGVVGMGLPTVTMGLLGLVMPPTQAAALTLVPGLATNLVQVLDGGHLRRLLPRLGVLLAGIGGGTLLGVLLLPAAMGPWASAALGLVLAAGAAANLAGFDPSVPPAREGRLAAATGLGTGLVTMATGVYAVPSAIFLRALGLPRDALIQALGLCFTLSSALLGVALAWQGVLHGQAALGSLLALIPTILGMRAGTLARRRIDPARFKRIFDTSMLAIGLVMVLKVLL